MIAGKIAGENAAQIKKDETKETMVVTNKKELPQSDLQEDSFSTKANQFIGRSSHGMGNELVVRVTFNDKQAIQNIEILKNSETETGATALKELPQTMIAQNSYDVDAVSGASATSWALKDAVKEAIEESRK